MKRLFASHLGRQVSASALSAGDALRLTLGEESGERTALATWRQAPNGDWLVEQDGITRTIRLSVNRGVAWVSLTGAAHTQAQTTRWQQVEAQRKAGASAETAVRSPMTGRVVVLSVQVGDLVHKGQAMVVVEAMKMEHTLKAPCDGTVAKVSCAVGQLVEGGQDLVDLHR